MTQHKKQHIRELIKSANLKGAINALYAHDLPKKIQNELDVLSARFNENENRFIKGIVKDEDYTLEKNRITDSLLTVLNLMEDLSDSEKQGSKPLVFALPRNTQLIFSILFIVSAAGISSVLIYNNFRLDKEGSARKDKVKELDDPRYTHSKNDLAKEQFLDESPQYNSLDNLSKYDFSKEMAGAIKGILDSLIRLKEFRKALEMLYRHSSESHISNRDTLKKYIAALQIAQESQLDEVFPDFPSKFILGIRDNKQGLFDRDKNMVSDFLYDEINPLFESLYITKIGDKYGFLNADGIEIVKPIYDDIYPEFGPLIWVQKNAKDGLIDRQGNVVQKMIYDVIWPPNEGMMHARKNGLWGFIDTTGAVKIEFQYDSAESFSDGKAFVAKGSRLMYINKQGVMIEEVK